MLNDPLVYFYFSPKKKKINLWVHSPFYICNANWMLISLEHKVIFPNVYKTYKVFSNKLSASEIYLIQNFWGKGKQHKIDWQYNITCYIISTISVGLWLLCPVRNTEGFDYAKLITEVIGKGIYRIKHAINPQEIFASKYLHISKINVAKEPIFILRLSLLNPTLKSHQYLPSLCYQ